MFTGATVGLEKSSAPGWNLVGVLHSEESMRACGKSMEVTVLAEEVACK